MKGLLLVTYVLILSRLGECNPCSPAESLDISEGLVNQNGSVFLYGVEFLSSTWYEVENNGTVQRFGCPCIGRICLRKCCGGKQVFLNLNCTDSNLTEVDPFSPQVYKGREPSSVVPQDSFFYLYGWPCDERYLVDTGTSEELFLQENGTLMEVARGGSQWHDPKLYCLEMNTESLSQSPRLVAGVCFTDVENTDDSPLLYTAYAIGLLISVPFLLATFFVYALIPELRNLHGMCLMAYCAGLIVAYPFLAFLKLNGSNIGVGMTGCFTVAFIIYYAFQTSFFWLNVMCFDIWRTFSGYRGGSTSKRREKKRFAMYGLYAWGVPMVLTAVTIAMQFSDVSQYVITPGFGSVRCWFVDWLSDLVYFFTPVLILVVCNVVFFSVTAHRIRSIRQETAILKGAESSRSDKLKKDKQSAHTSNKSESYEKWDGSYEYERNGDERRAVTRKILQPKFWVALQLLGAVVALTIRYGLYLKLFVVMGVNWTVELISFSVGGSNWYWIVVDLSNIALGFFIFFIFVWKKKVRILVQKRFRNMFGQQTASDGRTSRWATSSAPTEDTRISSDETALRMKDMR